MADYTLEEIISTIRKFTVEELLNRRNVNKEQEEEAVKIQQGILTDTVLTRIIGWYYRDNMTFGSSMDDFITNHKDVIFELLLFNKLQKPYII